MEYHQQSLALAEEMSATLPEAESDYQFGEYTDARVIGSRKSLGYTRFSLGFTYYWLNDYGKAIEQYEPSLAIAREIGDRQSEVIVLAQLGEVYFYLGNYDESIKYHDRAVHIAGIIKDLPSQGNSLNSLGNACCMLGKWTEARTYYQQALPILREVNIPNGQGNAIAGIGITLSNQNEHQQAIDYFQQSLSLFREQGNLYNQGRALNLLGQACYFLEDYERAMDYHQRSLAISQELQEIFSEEKARSELGLALFKCGKLKEAEENLRASMEVVESIRGKLGNNDQFKVSIFDRQTKPYQLLQVILIAQNKKHEALEIAERGRARAFVELLSRNPALSEFAQTTIAPPSVEQIQAIAREQKATIVEYSLIQTKGLEEAKLYIWVINPMGEINFELVELEPVGESIQEHLTSLSKLVVEARNGLGIEEEMLRDAKTSVSFEPPGHVEYNCEPLRQLYRYLIEPIVGFLPTEKDGTVIFIPQGELFLLPFCGLQDPATGEFLMERHSTRIVPSIQVLELTRQQEFNSQDRLVVGNPTKESDPLPASEEEAKAIATMLKTEPLIGTIATKAEILPQLPKAGLIHFGTHGRFDEREPLNSAIAFAPSGDDDGWFTVGEIIERYGAAQGSPLISASLMVLSACVTGRGKITGDGVIGLSRCLMAAGVPSLVVSLWKVDDLSTTLLMIEFYKNLLSNNNVMKALQEAQCWLRNATKQDIREKIEQLSFKPVYKIRRLAKLNQIKSEAKPFESPYYWAAFCAIGQETVHLG